MVPLLLCYWNVLTAMYLLPNITTTTTKQPTALKAHVKKQSAALHTPAPQSHPSSHGAQVWKGGPGWAHLDDVKRDPLTEPKQDRPTKTGMIQDMTPR